MATLDFLSQDVEAQLTFFGEGVVDQPLKYWIRASFDVRWEKKVSVYYETFPITRCTSRSVFLDCYGVDKRIGKDWIKKFAHPTKEEALFALKRRTQRRADILRNQLEDCQLFLELIK